MMAKIYRVNGDIDDVRPLNGKTFELDQLQAIVGGMIEIVYIGDGKLIVVDEEGRLKDKMHNAKASILTQGKVIGDIVGDMLLCQESEIE